MGVRLTGGHIEKIIVDHVVRAECHGDILAGPDMAGRAVGEGIKEGHVMERVTLSVVDELLPRLRVPAARKGRIIRVGCWEGQGTWFLVGFLDNSWDDWRHRHLPDGGWLGRGWYQGWRGWLVTAGRFVELCVDVARGQSRRDWLTVPLPVVVEDILRRKELQGV